MNLDEFSLLRLCRQEDRRMWVVRKTPECEQDPEWILRCDTFERTYIVRLISDRWQGSFCISFNDEHNWEFLWSDSIFEHLFSSSGGSPEGQELAGLLADIFTNDRRAEEITRKVVTEIERRTQ